MLNPYPGHGLGRQAGGRLGWLAGSISFLQAREPSNERCREVGPSKFPPREAENGTKTKYQSHFPMFRKDGENLRGTALIYFYTRKYCLISQFNYRTSNDQTNATQQLR